MSYPLTQIGGSGKSTPLSKYTMRRHAQKGRQLSIITRAAVPRLNTIGLEIWHGKNMASALPAWTRWVSKPMRVLWHCWAILPVSQSLWARRWSSRPRALRGGEEAWPDDGPIQQASLRLHLQGKQCSGQSGRGYDWSPRTICRRGCGYSRTADKICSGEWADPSTRVSAVLRVYPRMARTNWTLWKVS